MKKHMTIYIKLHLFTELWSWSANLPVRLTEWIWPSTIFPLNILEGECENNNNGGTKIFLSHFLSLSLTHLSSPHKFIVGNIGIKEEGA